jgi:hypothetical protein
MEPLVMLNLKTFPMALFVHLLISMTFFATEQGAFAGGQGSGGGNDIVARFTSLSNQLLDDGPFSEDDKNLLRKALSDSHITSVPVLIDERTHKAVPNQSQLLAWASRGSIQLKESSPDPKDASFTDLIFKRKPLAHELAHELFRATGLVNTDQKSIDENYQLSIGKYHLDQWPLYLPDQPNNGRLEPRGCPKGIILRGVNLFSFDRVEATIRANNRVASHLNDKLNSARKFHDWLSQRMTGNDVLLMAETNSSYVCRNNNYDFSPPFVNLPVNSPLSYIRPEFSVEFPWGVGIYEESKYYKGTFEFGVPAYLQLPLAHQMGDESQSTLVYLGTVNYFDVR